MLGRRIAIVPARGSVDLSALLDLATPRAYYLWSWLPTVLRTQITCHREHRVYREVQVTEEQRLISFRCLCFFVSSVIKLSSMLSVSAVEIAWKTSVPHLLNAIDDQLTPWFKDRGQGAYRVGQVRKWLFEQRAQRLSAR